MKTRQTPMFPRIRLLMMLFMLLSMAGSLSLTASAAPASTGSSGFGAFQTDPTVQMCEALDTDHDLNLTNDEISQNKTDFNGDGQVNDADRDIISSFCVAAPSTPINFVTICHATGSETHPYEVQTIRADAVISGHYGVQHQTGEDIIPSFTYKGELYPAQGDQSWLSRGCEPPPPPDTFTLTLAKYFCTIDDEKDKLLEPMIGDPSQYDCIEATDQEFTLSLDGYEYTTADLLAGVELEPGQYDVYEGVTFVDTVKIVDDDVFRNVLNFVPDVPEETINVYILKSVCDTINYDIEPGENPCEGVDNRLDETTINFTVTVDDQEPIGASLVVANGEGETGAIPVPVGSSYEVCEVVPEGVVGIAIGSTVENFEADYNCATFSGEDISDDFAVSFANDLAEEEEEITIWIYKEVCADLKEIDPEHPEDPCMGWDDGLDGTVINFTVTVDDGNDAVEDEVFPASLTVVDGWGQTSVVVPEGVSYTVCEAVPGQVEELSFASTLTPTTAIPADGCITFAGDDVIEAGEVPVLFQQTLKDEPEKPDQPEKPKPEHPKPPVKPVPKAVTGLPSTGSGMADETSMAPWMLMASAAVLAGTGVLLRKDRPAA